MTRTTGRRLIAATVTVVVLSFVVLFVPDASREAPEFWYCWTTQTASDRPGGAPLTDYEVSHLGVPHSGGMCPETYLIRHRPSALARLRKSLGFASTQQWRDCEVVEVSVGPDGSVWERWRPHDGLPRRAYRLGTGEIWVDDEITGERRPLMRR